MSEETLLSASRRVLRFFRIDEAHGGLTSPETLIAMDTLALQVEKDGKRAFQLGDRVRKKSGSSWQGKVVGFYSTALTTSGYAVESEREPGSVQIYPESALEPAS